MAETVNSAFMSQPAGSEDPSLGDDRIRSFKAAWKERMEKEHHFDLTEAGTQPRQGLHRAGSAVAFYQASAPTERNGVALGSTDAGIIWIDSDTGIVYFWDGSQWSESRSSVSDVLTLLKDDGSAGSTLQFNETSQSLELVNNGGTSYPVATVKPYAAGDYIFAYLNGTVAGTISTSYVKGTKDWVADKAGTVRVKYLVKRHRSSGTAYAAVYKNGVIVPGSEITNSTITAWTAGSVDVDVAVGDTIAIYFKTSGATIYSIIGNCRICSSTPVDSVPAGIDMYATGTDDTALRLPDMEVGQSITFYYSGAPSTGIVGPNTSGTYVINTGRYGVTSINGVVSGAAASIYTVASISYVFGGIITRVA